jgi:hypothetical protein
MNNFNTGDFVIIEEHSCYVLYDFNDSNTLIYVYLYNDIIYKKTHHNKADITYIPFPSHTNVYFLKEHEQTPTKGTVISYDTTHKTYNIRIEDDEFEGILQKNVYNICFQESAEVYSILFLKEQYPCSILTNVETKHLQCSKSYITSYTDNIGNLNFRLSYILMSSNSIIPIDATLGWPFFHLLYSKHLIDSIEQARSIASYITIPRPTVPAQPLLPTFSQITNDDEKLCIIKITKGIKNIFGKPTTFKKIYDDFFGKIDQDSLQNEFVKEFIKRIKDESYQKLINA